MLSEYLNIQTAVCITTMDRPESLRACLAALANCRPAPSVIVVSDDSAEESMRSLNRQLTEQTLNAKYVIGPRKGVCANRNNAVAQCVDDTARFVTFVDDDVLVSEDFFAVTARSVSAGAKEDIDKTIIDGTVHKSDGTVLSALSRKISFRGYFTDSEVPECVNIQCAVFPIALFKQEKWDENVFFGSEDAELCMRARRRGFRIVHVDELQTYDSQAGKGVLSYGTTPGHQKLSRYQLQCEAARLYIGVKRYTKIEPSPLRFVGFICIYGIHIITYLARRRSLASLPTILRLSNVERLFQPHR